MNWRTTMNSAAAMSTLSHHGERDRIANRLRFAIMAITGFYNSIRQPLAHFGAFMAVAGFVDGLDSMGQGRCARTICSRPIANPGACRIRGALQCPLASRKTWLPFTPGSPSGSCTQDGRLMRKSVSREPAPIQELANLAT
jgi:hypothetical protein